ncbi:MAG: hypothetical protein QXQ76_05705 [Candidatus Bathyarchaeia archaeon]
MPEEVEVELTYYAGDVKRQKGVEISEDEVRRICGEKGVALKAFNVTTQFTIKKISLLISGEEDRFREAIKSLIGLYGKPGLPGLAFGKMKRGKQIAESVLKELGA